MSTVQLGNERKSLNEEINEVFFFSLSLSCINALSTIYYVFPSSCEFFLYFSGENVSLADETLSDEEDDVAKNERI